MQNNGTDSQVLRIGDTLGRVLLGGIFIAAGVDKIRDFAGTKKYTESKRLPLPAAMVGGAAAVELIAGPLFVLGVAPRFTASLLAGFLIPTAALFHDFWNQESKSSQKAEAMHFFKDLAIIGGLISVALRDFEKVRSRSSADLLPGASMERNAVRPDYMDNAQFDAA